MRVATLQQTISALNDLRTLGFVLDRQDDPELLPRGELLSSLYISPQLTAFVEPSRRGRERFGALTLDEEHAVLRDERAVDVRAAFKHPPLSGATFRPCVVEGV